MDIFVELSIVIVTAAVLSGLMRLLKQPIVIGYVLTGLLLGPQFLGLFDSAHEISVFSEMGIAILLFIVGLHLSPKEIKDFGGSAFLIGIAQVLLTSLLTFVLSYFLGFSISEGIYIGVALSFSSTIIVLKLLSDKKDLEKLYGRVTIGILLLQDIVAALALIFASTFASENSGIPSFLLLIIKSIGLTLAISLISVYVLPFLSGFFAKSQEFLFIFSLAWGFGLASVFNLLGFSIEIGALVAGVALSVTPYAQEISSRLKPLRDFFVVMFFILLGTQMDFSNFSTVLVPFLVFFGFIVLVKPLIIMILMSLFKYSKKSSFLASLSLAQISEFSMIFVLLGVRVGHLNTSILSLITLLGLSSIAFSSYLIIYAERLYPLFMPLLKLIERKKVIEESDNATSYDAILFGCNRAGYDFIKMFSPMGEKFLAVDFDPDIISYLMSQGTHCVYGDAEDSEFLAEVNIEKAHIVVSTIPEFETNSFLVSKIRSMNPDSIVLLISYSVEDALRLYDLGATYVILPHFISGEFAARLTSEAEFDIHKLHEKRDEHLDYLRERKRLGHTHPTWGHH